MQDFYKHWLREKLSKYLEVKDSISKLFDKIKYCESKLEGSTSASYGEQTGHGQCGSDEKFLNALAELDILRENYDSNLKLISDVEDATEMLNDMEKDILFTLYGTRQRGGKARKLSHKYHYDERQIFRLGDDIASKVCYNLFGDC